MKITDYINQHHKGNKSDAARHFGVSRGLMQYWVRRGAIVNDGKVYLPSDAIVIDSKAFTLVGSGK